MSERHIEYFGGPLDGHVVEIPTGAHRWAKWTDPDTGQPHFYQLACVRSELRYVYQPEAAPWP